MADYIKCPHCKAILDEDNIKELGGLDFEDEIDEYFMVDCPECKKDFDLHVCVEVVVETSISARPPIKGELIEDYTTTCNGISHDFKKGMIFLFNNWNNPLGEWRFRYDSGSIPKDKIKIIE